MRFSTVQPQPSRPAVRTIPCPECSAAAGEKCVGARGKARESNHMGRVETYKARNGWNDQ